MGASFDLSHYFLDIEDVLFPQDKKVTSTYLDIRPRELPEHNRLANMYSWLNECFAVVTPRAYRYHYSLVRLLFGLIGQEHAAIRLICYFDTLHDNSILHRTNLNLRFFDKTALALLFNNLCRLLLRFRLLRFELFLRQTFG